MALDLAVIRAVKRSHRRRRPWVPDDALKRLLDVVVAGAALLVLFPLLGVLALAIKLESPGPAFYRARRVGRGGREIHMLKFRKMRFGAVGPALTVDGDARMTRLGSVLSKTKLDEIPQLWNVLTGSMSLVGPRPQDPTFVALRTADYERILQVKPGVTGLYQLALARESAVLDDTDAVGDYVRRLLPQKTALDRLYVARRSLLMDLHILAWTALAIMLRIEVAVHRSTGRLSLRRRPPVARPALEAPQHGNGRCNGPAPAVVAANGALPEPSANGNGAHADVELAQ